MARCRHENRECLNHTVTGTTPQSDENLRFSETGAHKPNARADVRGQDNVDCELYGSYFTNAVA